MIPPDVLEKSLEYVKALRGMYAMLGPWELRERIAAVLNDKQAVLLLDERSFNVSPVARKHLQHASMWLGHVAGGIINTAKTKEERNSLRRMVGIGVQE